MNSASMLILLVSLLSLSQIFVSCSTETSPVFMWSNTKLFKEHNLQEINIISASDIVKGLNHKESPIAKYVTSQSEKPEVVFVFVEPKLSTEQVPILAHSYESRPNGGAFTHLKKYVESSKSSLVVPYTTSSSEFAVSDELVNSFISTQGKVYLVGNNIQSISKVTKITLDELLTKLNGGEISNNGVTDLVVINFDAEIVSHLYDDSLVHAQYVADDAILGKVMESIDSSFFAIFTSNAGTTLINEVSAPVPNENVEQQINDFNEKFTQTGPLYYTNWPNGIIQALLVMAPFIFIVFIGICCTLQLQSDLKFDAEKSILRNTAK